MNRTLIIAPAWIGDMVMAHTLVQRLVAADATHEIHMLAPPATAPIAQRMTEVAQVHELAIAHGEFGLRKRYQMGRELAGIGFSHSYVLPNSWKSALVPWFARVPHRSGWLGEARRVLLNDTAALQPEQLPLMIERFMALQDLGATQTPGYRLLKPYPRPALEVDVERQQQLGQQHGLHMDGTAVALCPGAEFGQAKRWPVEHVAAVARALLAASVPVWLLGGPADRDVCGAVVQLVTESEVTTGPLLTNLAGETSLSDAVDVLAAARAVVCNDSGLMHVACAVDTPSVAVYGSTSPDFTPPLHSDAHALTLVDLDNGAGRLNCQPCFARECRYGHGDCLAQLSPTYVLDALTRLGVLAA